MDTSNQLFPVLNLAKVKRLSEADRRLPQWLSHPVQFPAVNLIEFGQNVDDLAEYIDEDIRNYLKKTMLVERLFPVQKCLIPNLSMQFKSRPYRRPNDVCVSAPTGSGKTLAYVIPVVNYLRKSLKRSLRALVILPSRDLATQVFKTFTQLCDPAHLRCAMAIGESGEPQRGYFKRLKRLTDGDQVEELIDRKQCSILQDQYRDVYDDEQYVSTIDILISTPGVLVDLMHNSPGFSLAELEILILDEADRLMANHKHDWLNTVERSIFPDLVECPCDPALATPDTKKSRVCFSSTSGCAMKHAYESKPLHKLLFSATLSSDPQLLMHMNLYQPRLFLATKPSITGTKIRNSLGSQASTPSGSPMPYANATVNTRSELLTSSAIPDQLEEKMFITETKEKLFIIWYLFHELKLKNTLCFSNQIQTSYKLCKFLNEIKDVQAAEFSSNLKPEARNKILAEYQKGKIDVIVCTDIMARGMDIEGIEYVVSYDMPASEVFYVHRVGRTARAGKKGTAITLVDTKQLVQFKKIVQLAHKMPNSMRLSDVVEEMKVPHTIRKNQETYDLYTNTLENYQDKLDVYGRSKGRQTSKPK